MRGPVASLGGERSSEAGAIPSADRAFVVGNSAFAGGEGRAPCGINFDGARTRKTGRTSRGVRSVERATGQASGVVPLGRVVVGG